MGRKEMMGAGESLVLLPSLFWALCARFFGISFQPQKSHVAGFGLNLSPAMSHGAFYLSLGVL
jgi:hypothetical protein